MRQTLRNMIDKPVTVRTLPEKPSWKPIQGVVFDVRDDVVDILIDAGIMKTVRIAMIIDVSLSHLLARQTVLEDPPDHPDYAPAKRRLFEAEELTTMCQPAELVEARAAAAAELFRGVRQAAPDHRGVARRLQRAHFLATGNYAYESHPEVTGGELDDPDYAAAKQRSEKLDKALAARRPEREIAIILRYVARHSARALALYPNHSELSAWFARAEELRQKLSRNTQVDADMTQPFDAASIAARAEGAAGFVKPPL